MKSDLKETAVALIPKDELAFIKDDEGFKTHIITNLSSSLAERIMGILEREEEIIVKQSDLRVSEYMPTCSVEYRREIKWSPLVRCEDCKHGRPYEHTKEYVACEVDGESIDRDCDFFCKYGERREDGEWRI